MSSLLSKFEETLNGMLADVGPEYLHDVALVLEADVKIWMLEYIEEVERENANQ